MAVANIYIGIRFDFFKVLLIGYLNKWRVFHLALFKICEIAFPLRCNPNKPDLPSIRNKRLVLKFDYLVSAMQGMHTPQRLQQIRAQKAEGLVSYPALLNTSQLLFRNIELSICPILALRCLGEKQKMAAFAYSFHRLSRQNFDDNLTISYLETKLIEELG
jgi:hypothetical protein